MNTLVRNRKGLTLIELLAVIVILGVIAAIAVPAIGGIISKSKEDADAQSVELIRSAAVMWALQQDTVPASVTVHKLNADGYLSSAEIQAQSGANPGYYYNTVTITNTGGVVNATTVTQTEDAPTS